MMIVMLNADDDDADDDADGDDGDAADDDYDYEDADDDEDDEDYLYCQPQSPGGLLGPIDKAKVNSRVVRSCRSNAQAEPCLVLDN